MKAVIRVGGNATTASKIYATVANAEYLSINAASIACRVTGK